jgi:hypothetical protein
MVRVFAMANLDRAKWRSLLENPAAMKSLFGDTDPDLSRVRFTGLHVAELCSMVSVTLAVDWETVHRPKRWGTGGGNTVSIELQCIDIEELSLGMRTGESIVSCEIGTGDSSERTVRIHGDRTELIVRCQRLRANKLIPYHADYSPASL